MLFLIRFINELEVVLHNPNCSSDGDGQHSKLKLGKETHFSPFQRGLGILAALVIAAFAPATWDAIQEQIDPPPDASYQKKKVVRFQYSYHIHHPKIILGSGWGALPIIKSIDKRYYDVIVVSPRNYFLVR